MKSALERIITEYNNQVIHFFRPTENELSRYFLNDVPEILINQVQLDERKYKVQASVGQGNWTETPWVSIFDREITESAMKGFYIVYLFRKDMKGVYLSLNQGTTYIKNKYKGRKPRTKMEEVALKLKAILDFSLDDFPATSIDLASYTDNSKNYMAAHICGKYYPLERLPENEELQNDLRKLIKVYQQLKAFMGLKNTDHFIDYLLNLEEIEDTQFQSDIQLVAPADTPRVPQTVPQKERTSEGMKWKRDASIAKEAVQAANYLCEIDPYHITFVSAVTGKNFVEAHHLIPMSLQSNFCRSLDVPGNIVSLCPNCHRSIHHANKAEKYLLIKKLYSLRKQALIDFGIDVPLEDLFVAYK
ncbi:MrcB family domain-containing protein [Shouchella rhizosphaerae]|uniref:MrcB family domain-containing protein n=1 Tax=Shouchella rhizosphaerae TaxID=866786 RepID=UPI003F7FAB1E